MKCFLIFITVFFQYFYSQNKEDGFSVNVAVINLRGGAAIYSADSIFNRNLLKKTHLKRLSIRHNENKILVIASSQKKAASKHPVKQELFLATGKSGTKFIGKFEKISREIAQKVLWAAKLYKTATSSSSFSAITKTANVFVLPVYESRIAAVRAAFKDYSVLPKKITFLKLTQKHRLYRTKVLSTFFLRLIVPRPPPYL